MSSVNFTGKRTRESKKTMACGPGRTHKQEAVDSDDDDVPLSSRMRFITVGTRITKRDFPPADYLLKIDSFSLLAEKVSMYESGLFEVGGHKWRLVLHPNGNKKKNVEGFLSLYLELAETKSLPWELNVSFKFFVLDQIHGRFTTIEEPGVAFRKFHCIKTSWGFDNLLSLKSFHFPFSGYLVDDTCVFGAELFVLRWTGKAECLSLVKPATYNYNIITFKLENLSKLDKHFYESQVYTVEGMKWKLQVYPKGCSLGTGWLSVYLMSVDASNFPSWKKVFAEYKLRVKDQTGSKHHEEIGGKDWLFSQQTPAWGFPKLIPLTKLYDKSKSYIVKDTLLVEAEILIFSKHVCL